MSLHFEWWSSKSYLKLLSDFFDEVPLCCDPGYNIAAHTIKSTVATMQNLEATTKSESGREWNEICIERSRNV